MIPEEYNPREALRRAKKRRQAPVTDFAFALRDATEADIPYLLDIYNHYVANSTVTFDEDPQTLKEMRAKFTTVSKLGFPWIVAESPRGEILGYATVTPWKAKAAYRFTVENSIYLGPASTGKGLGSALMAELLTRSKEAGIKEIVAVIADRGADASIRLHEAYGFKKIGHMGKVGFKFGRWLGTVRMQKSLT